MKLVITEGVFGKSTTIEGGTSAETLEVVRGLSTEEEPATESTLLGSLITPRKDVPVGARVLILTTPDYPDDAGSEFLWVSPDAARAWHCQTFQEALTHQEDGEEWGLSRQSRDDFDRTWIVVATYNQEG